MMTRLLECVPNFSEGRDPEKIRLITAEIEAVDGVRLLNVDPGRATNRTVVTFVGEPEAVVEAAFRAIKKAAEVIDMRQHSGEHPRMGATDVCPMVPISGLTMAEAAQYARQLGERVGKELGLSGYFYEEAATSEERRNLSTIRAGEYEGLEAKLQDPRWKPDFGPATFNAGAGATVIGARDFLVAYNINLNTTSTRRANAIAFDLRESGRSTKNPDGTTTTQPGLLKSVKGIGWYIEEYGIAQVSLNLTNIRTTPVHVAFDTAVKAANARGIRVTGSELVGLVPLNSLLDAGRYFLEKQQRSVGVSEAELVKIAVRSLGLDELAPFDPEERVIEYKMRQADGGAARRLVSMSLAALADETASESPAPGGGSIAAAVGALGAALGTMVANLSAHKRGWDDRWAFFSEHAAQGQRRKDALLALVDADTAAFNQIMACFGMPNKSDAEKAARKAAIQAATKGAIETPLRVMEEALASMDVIEAMARDGQPSSVTDAGVGAACARTAVLGAALNVQVNVGDLEDADFKADALARAAQMLAEAERREGEILAVVRQKLGM
jgi:glutamate formiminotransferase / formiminotetrahydrofolate cyclodeaminase